MSELEASSAVTPNITSEMASLQVKITELEQQISAAQSALEQAELVVKIREQSLKFAWSAEKISGWDFDIKAGKTTVSVNHFELWGFPPESFSAEKINDTQWIFEDVCLYDYVHPQDLDLFKIMDQEALRTGKWSMEFRPNLENERWLLGAGETFFNEAGEAVRVVGITIDITERKRMETDLRASLREKEVLLREIHHRVKNNFQVIASLLNLQADAIDDPRISQLLLESQNRIHTFSMIHEDLYQSEQISSIDLSQYLSVLVDRLFYSYDINPSKISKSVQLSPLPVDIDTALTCGLITNELVTNALKHAFPGDRTGTLTISSHFDEAGQYVLNVQDNGVGLPPGLDITQNKTLGLQLVRSLATKLRGQLTLNQSSYTTFQLSFITQ